MKVKLKKLTNTGNIENVNINVVSFNFGSLLGFITLFFGILFGFLAFTKKGGRN